MRQIDLAHEPGISAYAQADLACAAINYDVICGLERPPFVRIVPHHGDFRGTFPFPVQFFVSKNMSESPDCVILGSSGEDEEPQLEQHQGRNNPSRKDVPRFTQYDVESIPPSTNQGEVTRSRMLLVVDTT